MATTPASVTGLLQASFAGAGVQGQYAPQLALAIGQGFASYVTSSPIVQTADVGTLGAGAGVGFGLIVAPPALQGALSAALSANGMNGVFKEPVALAIALALCQALATAQTLTVHPGTGIGTGTVVAVVPVPTSSVSLMQASFAGASLLGTSAAGFALAVAQAVDQVLPTAKGQVVISGPTSPYPGGGSGFGRIL